MRSTISGISPFTSSSPAHAQGAQVQRHVVDQRREVGAMVQVEAAQEILIGLAAARMLDGNHSRHRLEQLRHAQQRRTASRLPQWPLRSPPSQCR